ncbi:MAG TPA: hypothetical protein H9784_08580 [Candidatus Desulfovibrio intestinavium]|uniref:Uncharacterized protein n=1 Tax=Candidatus Desulfovibrio intestinavium TaxID=2838534 RepID=A0A9D2HP37_9BACT|nr:hypothetical protein [Candidatus Desulfovibrio intestinavium]
MYFIVTSCFCLQKFFKKFFSHSRLFFGKKISLLGLAIGEQSLFILFSRYVVDDSCGNGIVSPPRWGRRRSCRRSTPFRLNAGRHAGDRGVRAANDGENGQRRAMVGKLRAWRAA